MYTKDFFLNSGSKRQVVKDFGAVTPHIYGPVFSQALVVKSVHLRYLSALVISANQRDTIRISHLQSKQQEEGFHAIVSTIDEIAHKEIVGFRTLATNFEELDEVIELAMDVATDGDRSLNFYDVAFFGQDFLGFVAQIFYF